MVGEVAAAGQIGPFERFVAGNRITNRPDFAFRIEGLACWADQRGLMWPLVLGVIYDTDVSEAGGQTVERDRTYYAPNDNPTVAGLVRSNFLEGGPPISGQFPSGLISVSGP